ncbi:unnamed protein product [Boreogadus saida]
MGRHGHLVRKENNSGKNGTGGNTEREFSNQPSLKGDDCQDQSGPAKHCCRRCGARVDAAGAALSRGTTTVPPETQANGPPAPPYGRNWWGPDRGGPRPHPQILCGQLETGVLTREEGCTATGPLSR